MMMFAKNGFKIQNNNHVLVEITNCKCTQMLFGCYNTNAQVLLVTGGLDEYFGYLASTEVSLSSGKQ